MREVYLDNSATTRVCKSAAEKAYNVMVENFGNPSSLHKKGILAEKEMEEARKIVAERLGTSSGEIYFTSGGTESNNIAVFGAVNAKKRLGNRIVTTAIEHHSVLDSIKSLEKQSFEVVYLKPDSFGNISEEQIFNAITPDTIFVSIMAVNNEIGSVLPIKAASKAIKRSKSPAILHVDAVQAFCKTDIKPERDGIDLLSVSAHKIHGPKGIGALYIKRDVRIIPSFFGGEQEKKIRPGTQSTPLIAAFGEAVRVYPQNTDYIKELKDYALEQLLQIDEVTINSDVNSNEYIINLSVVGIRSEIMLHYLENLGIYVSSGSACAMGKPSHVLSAMGLPREIADSALRVSFCINNTKEDIDIFIDGLKAGIKNIVRSK